MFSAGINFILIFTSLNSVAPRLFHSRSPNDPYLSLVFSRPSSVLPAFFGWLLCVIRHPGGRQCHDGYNFSSFFVTYIATPNDANSFPPHIPIVLIRPTQCFLRSLVGCCMFYLIGGHQRRGPHPSLYFAKGRILASKAAPTAQIKANSMHPTSPIMR